MTNKNGMKCDGTGVWCGSPGCCPTASTAPASAQEGQGGLTDEQIVEVLHSLGIDTYPSKYGFDTLQVSATSVPSIRKVVERCFAIFARQTAPTVGSVPQADALVARVRALAEKWNKDAIADGFAGSAPAFELFDLLDTAPQEQASSLCPICEAEPARNGGPCAVCFWTPAPGASRAAVPGDFLPQRDVADEIVLLSNVMRHHPQLKPVIGREALIMRCVRKALAAAPVAQEGTQADEAEAPSAKQEKLRALADRIDHEKLWKRPLMYRARLTDDQRDRLDAGVMLRRYADLMAPGRWLVLPPTGNVQFSAGSLDKVTEMAKRDQERSAAQQASAQVDAGGGSDAPIHQWRRRGGQAWVDACLEVASMGSPAAYEWRTLYPTKYMHSAIAAALANVTHAPESWTVLHNGKSVSADTLTGCMAAARQLRTPEEAARASENLAAAIAADSAEEQAERAAARNAVLDEVAAAFRAHQRNWNVAAAQFVEALKAAPVAQEGKAVESDLTTVDCPACGGKGACDECSGQGKIIVSRRDMAALAPAHKPCTMRMSQGADVVEVTGSGDGQQDSAQVDAEGGA